MTGIGRLWAGRLYGTNTGNLFAELNSSDGGITGVIRFLDTALGPVVYDVAGEYNAGRLTLDLRPKQSQEGVELGLIEATATLAPDGSLRGEWASTLGTGGTFQLFPHDPPSNPRQSTALETPEQIHTANHALGTIRLYGDDAKDLIDLVRREFAGARPVVTYSSGRNEVSKYADDFLAERSPNEKLNYLKIFVQEPEAHGINRTVTVELSATGGNGIRVQGTNESWVIGKAEALARSCRRYENFILTKYKKHGLGLNQILFLLMLVLLPELQPLWLRAAFVVAAVVLFSTLVWIHGRLIPNAAIYGTARKPGMIERALPSLWSFVIAAAASVAAGVVVWLITKENIKQAQPAKGSIHLPEQPPNVLPK